LRLAPRRLSRVRPHGQGVLRAPVLAYFPSGAFSTWPRSRPSSSTSDPSVLSPACGRGTARQSRQCMARPSRWNLALGVYGQAGCGCLVVGCTSSGVIATPSREQCHSPAMSSRGEDRRCCELPSSQRREGYSDTSGGLARGDNAVAGRGKSLMY
jgi:hypothetical protein